MRAGCRRSSATQRRGGSRRTAGEQRGEGWQRRAWDHARGTKPRCRGVGVRCQPGATEQTRPSGLIEADLLWGISPDYGSRPREQGISPFKHRIYVLVWQGRQIPPNTAKSRQNASKRASIWEGCAQMCMSRAMPREPAVRASQTPVSSGGGGRQAGEQWENRARRCFAARRR